MKLIILGSERVSIRVILSDLPQNVLWSIAHRSFCGHCFTTNYKVCVVMQRVTSWSCERVLSRFGRVDKTRKTGPQHWALITLGSEKVKESYCGLRPFVLCIASYDVTRQTLYRSCSIQRCMHSHDAVRGVMRPFVSSLISVSQSSSRYAVLLQQGSFEPLGVGHGESPDLAARKLMHLPLSFCCRAPYTIPANRENRLAL